MNNSSKNINYSDENLINEIITEVSNRRKHDKASVAYMVGMMNANSFMSLYYDSLHRQYILNHFETLIRIPENLMKLNNGHCLNNIFSKY